MPFHITKHATERWEERFYPSIYCSALDEFNDAKKVKRSKLREGKITAVKGYRYYMSHNCVFVVSIGNNVIVTIIKRIIPYANK